MLIHLFIQLYLSLIKKLWWSYFRCRLLFMYIWLHYFETHIPDACYKNQEGMWFHQIPSQECFQHIQDLHRKNSRLKNTKFNKKCNLYFCSVEEWMIKNVKLLGFAAAAAAALALFSALANSARNLSTSRVIMIILLSITRLCSRLTAFVFFSNSIAFLYPPRNGN